MNFKDPFLYRFMKFYGFVVKIMRNICYILCVINHILLYLCLASRRI